MIRREEEQQEVNYDDDDDDADDDNDDDEDGDDNFLPRKSPVKQFVKMCWKLTETLIDVAILR